MKMTKPIEYEPKKSFTSKLMLGVSVSIFVISICFIGIVFALYFFTVYASTQFAEFIKTVPTYQSTLLAVTIVALTFINKKYSQPNIIQTIQQPSASASTDSTSKQQ